MRGSDRPDLPIHEGFHAIGVYEQRPEWLPDDISYSPPIVNIYGDHAPVDCVEVWSWRWHTGADGRVDQTAYRCWVSKWVFEDPPAWEAHKQHIERRHQVAFEKSLLA